MRHTTSSAAHITTRNVPAEISIGPRDRRPSMAAFIGHLELFATNRRTGRTFLLGPSDGRAWSNHGRDLGATGQTRKSQPKIWLFSSASELISILAFALRLRLNSDGGFYGQPYRLFGQHRNRRHVRMSEVRGCLSLDPRKKFENKNGAISLPSTLRCLGSRMVRAVQLYKLGETEAVAARPPATPLIKVL